MSREIAEMLEAGAAAVQLGTAFLLVQNAARLRLTRKR